MVNNREQKTLQLQSWAKQVASEKFHNRPYTTFSATETDPNKFRKSISFKLNRQNKNQQVKTSELQCSSRLVMIRNNMLFLTKPWDNLIQLQRQLKMKIKNRNWSNIPCSSIICGCNRNASPSEFPTAKYETQVFSRTWTSEVKLVKEHLTLIWTNVQCEWSGKTLRAVSNI